MPLPARYFKGFIDKCLMLPASLTKIGLAQILGEVGFTLAEEALSTVIASILGAALVGLISLTIYTAFVSKRR